MVLDLNMTGNKVVSGTVLAFTTSQMCQYCLINIAEELLLSFSFVLL